jgi:hypothetical protein
MHAHQHSLTAARLAANQGDVAFRIDIARIGNGAEFAKFGLDASLSAAVNVTLVLEAVLADQNPQLMPF